MPQHPFTTETPLRHKLRGQLARLNRVIAESDRSWRVAEALRHARRISHYLEQPDMALRDSRGLFGANGIGPAIDDVCRHVEREGLTEVHGDPARRIAA